MHYVVYNSSAKICRVFNSKSHADTLLKRNSEWCYANDSRGFKKHNEAFNFAKKYLTQYLIQGNNGETIHIPNGYVSPIESTIAKLKNVIQPKPSILSMANVKQPNAKTETKAVQEEIVVDKVVQDNKSVNVSDEVEKQSDEQVITNPFSFELLEDIDVVCDAVDKKMCYVEKEFLTSITPKEVIKTVEVPVKAENTVENIANMLTDDLLSTALVNKLLHLDIFELQRVFTDMNTALVCVDGSFKEGIMSYAYVMIVGGKVIEDYDTYGIEGSVSNQIQGSSIRAEIVGARQAIAKAAAMGIKNLLLCYDCMAVEKAAKGEKAVKVPEQQNFRLFYEAMKQLVNVHFIKVKGHSGVPLHTRADVLAGIKVGRSI